MSSAFMVRVASILPHLRVILLWVGLVAHRARTLRQSEPLRNSAWFLGVLRRGLAMMRRCTWIVLIPVAAQIANSNMQFLFWYAWRPMLLWRSGEWDR